MREEERGQGDTDRRGQGLCDHESVKAVNKTKDQRPEAKKNNKKQSHEQALPFSVTSIVDDSQGQNKRK